MIDQATKDALEAAGLLLGLILAMYAIEYRHRILQIVAGCVIGKMAANLWRRYTEVRDRDKGADDGNMG